VALQTVAIPREMWDGALAAFGAVHDRWLIDVDVLSPALGAQPEIHGLPLTGITFEPPDGGAIVIAAGRGAAEHVAHAIRHPTQVWLRQTASGADAALEIESGDGARTILRFRTAALPETVDGLLR
jgi:hypothetical protein